MSASEKLKALEPLRPEQVQPAVTSLAWEDYERLKAYADALPKIVAVVEAADNYAPTYYQVDQENFAGPKLRRALAALDKALGAVEA